MKRSILLLSLVFLFVLQPTAWSRPPLPVSPYGHAKIEGILSSQGGEQLIATHTVTSGTLHIATKDGEAMFFHDSTDFSSYAGGNYLFEFTDAAGKVATAYPSTVGGGEALGDEELSNPSFDGGTSGWLAAVDCTIASVAGGQSNNCLEITRTGGSVQYIRSTDGNTTSEKGKLYKISIYAKSGTSGDEAFQASLAPSSGTAIFATTTGSWVQHSGYSTHNYDGSSYWMNGISKRSPTAGTMLFDEASVKPLTDVPATGLKLVSTLGGATRNMTSVESGFNTNTITKVEIYRVR